MPDSKTMMTTLKKKAPKDAKSCPVEDFLKKSAAKLDDPTIDVLAGTAKLAKLIAAEKKKAGSDKDRKKQLEAVEKELASFEAERSDIPGKSVLP